MPRIFFQCSCEIKLTPLQFTPSRIYIYIYIYIYITVAEHWMGSSSSRTSPQHGRDEIFYSFSFTIHEAEVILCSDSSRLQNRNPPGYSRVTAISHQLWQLWNLLQEPGFWKFRLAFTFFVDIFTIFTSELDRVWHSQPYCVWAFCSPTENLTEFWPILKIARPITEVKYLSKMSPWIKSLVLGRRGIQKSNIWGIRFEGKRRRAERESGGESEPRHYISDLLYVCLWV